MPQSHNRRAVAAAAKDDWIDFTYQRLDREKMIDLDFGRPMNDAKLRRVLAETYDNIVSDGLIDFKPGGFAWPGIIKRRQESRFLTFRDASAGLDYQKRFGEADVFTLVTGYVEVMARDIALIDEMRKMIDPTANAAFRRIERRALRERGQSSFSPPGSGFPPARGPDPGEALE